MKTTERKYWQCGHDIRGGWYHQRAYLFDTGAHCYGILLGYGWRKRVHKVPACPVISLELFKLI